MARKPKPERKAKPAVTAHLKRKKSTGNRKPSGIRSSIPRDEFVFNAAAKLEHGIREWMTRLRELLKEYEALSGSPLPRKFFSTVSRDYVKNILSSTPAKQQRVIRLIEPIWRKYKEEHEQAIRHGDADWFDRQAKALRGGYSRAEYKGHRVPNLGRFEAAVLLALGSNAHIYDPSTMFRLGGRTGCTAQEILDGLEQRREEFYTKKQTDRCKARNIELTDQPKEGVRLIELTDQPKEGVRLIVEGRRFSEARRAREAIKKLADEFGYELAVKY